MDWTDDVINNEKLRKVGLKRIDIRKGVGYPNLSGGLDGTTEIVFYNEDFDLTLKCKEKYVGAVNSYMSNVQDMIDGLNIIVEELEEGKVCGR
jgi:hypothetical protein